jgi:hypothetical protein
VLKRLSANRRVFEQELDNYIHSDPISHASAHGADFSGSVSVERRRDICAGDDISEVARPKETGLNHATDDLPY